MISRIAIKGALSFARLCIPTVSIFSFPKFSFGKIEKINKYRKNIDDEIKSEESQLNDLTEYDAAFSKGGWTLVKEQTLVELSKSTDNYQIRILSNIKSPTNFDDNQAEEGQQQNEGQQNPNQMNGDMNEVTILITKKGNQKTMVINTIVSEGFEISSILFTESYAKAKATRFDIFGSNQYTGPDMQTLSDQLFESVYGFIEDEFGITNDVMVNVADYCTNAEQSFYIDWLKDLKSIL